MGVQKYLLGVNPLGGKIKKIDNVKARHMDGKARRAKAKDEPAAPAPLGPQGLAGEVRSDSPKLHGSGQRDLVGVLPQGKGARGGPAQKKKDAQGGVPRECKPSDQCS